MRYSKPWDYNETPFPDGWLIGTNQHGYTDGVVRKPWSKGVADLFELPTDHPARTKFEAIVGEGEEKGFFDTKDEAVSFVIECTRERAQPT